VFKETAPAQVRNTNPRRQTEIRQLNPNYSPKYPGVSWFLSFLVPGVGQFYNGSSSGVAFLLTYVGGGGLMYGGYYLTTEGEEDLGLTMAGVGAAMVLTSWIWAQIDAPIKAVIKNRANRYLSWNLGNGDAVLALQPVFDLAPASFNSNAAFEPTIGLGLKLKF